MIRNTRQAYYLCRNLLERTLPRRWAHVIVVGDRARAVAQELNVDNGRVLEMSAWCHDIGYASPIAQRGFHPLDGARHLRKVGTPRNVYPYFGDRRLASVRPSEIQAWVSGLSSEPDALSASTV